MDDFLHNLRKSTERNYDRRNKQQQYNNPQYRGPERRGVRDQQRRPFQKKSEFEDMVSELAPELKAVLAGIEDGQKKLITVVERSAQAQERQAEVLGTIAALLQRLIDAGGSDISLPLNASHPAPGRQLEGCDCEQTAPSVSVDRGDVVDRIVMMRQNGLTYKEIAQQLEDEHIPTFSGKGAWHAQTVHKVCNKGV